MRGWIRAHVTGVTIALTVVSAVIVFAATLEQIPSAYLPRAPEAVLMAIPHINAGLAVIALVAMGRGYLAITSGAVEHHRRSMAVALGAFIVFLVLYLYNVAVTGPGTFTGPDVVRTYVYLPLLTVHIGLAVVCLPLVYYAFLVATTTPVAEVPRTNHATVARPGLALWAVSFLLGLVVYLMLYIVY